MEGDKYELDIELPLFIELKEISNASNNFNDFGAYSKILINANQFIGTFKGKIRKSISLCSDTKYVWTIFSTRDQPLFYIDGSDPRDCNWLRFVRSTTDIAKQNIVCMQKNQQINYFTSKEIQPGDGLFIYIPEKKKQNRNKDIKIRTSLRRQAKLLENTSPALPLLTSSLGPKTWTCQMCKRQFDLRNELNKHQCIDNNLRLLKKKKELRKKKIRDAQWKRKIDLSYIETTSLVKLSQNIADNLSFCIDGTYTDLKAYSREVKDYLISELGSETQVQMFLRGCFPDVYKKLGAAPSALMNIDANLISKANSYFVDSVYVPSKKIDHEKTSFSFRPITTTSNGFNCKSCRHKFNTISDLIQHQREFHNLNFNTSFDCYNQSANINKNNLKCSNSPIGYFQCDPFAYVLNLHWDQTLEKKCEKCSNLFARPKYLMHFSKCVNNQDDNQDNQIVYSNAKQSDFSIFSEIINEIINEIESANSKTIDQIYKRKRVESATYSEPASLYTDQLRASSRIKEIGQKLTENITDIITNNSAISRDDKKVYTCFKCALEFTSINSVYRHQDKSCLRVKVVNLVTSIKVDNKIQIITKKKCPICTAIFLNTHRLSIHIYKHHSNLLGPAALPPIPEAKYLYEVQLNKTKELESIKKQEHDEEADNDDEDEEIDLEN